GETAAESQSQLCMESAHGLCRGCLRFPHNASASAALGTPVFDFQNGACVLTMVGLRHSYGGCDHQNGDPFGRPPLSCPFVSAQLRGFCGARRLRSFCFALAPSRFWFPVWSKNSIALRTRDIFRLVSKAPCRHTR